MCTFSSEVVYMGIKCGEIRVNSRFFQNFKKQNGGDNERRRRIESYGLCDTFVSLKFVQLIIRV
jgi:hypothetical protein